MSLIEAWSKIYLENKYKIEEMARTKEKIINDLDFKRVNMYNHLINCYLWTNTTDYEKWKGEVRASEFSTFSIKGTNKYPTSKQLWKWCMEDWVIEVTDKITDIVNQAYLEEKNKRIKLGLKGDLKLPQYDSKLITEYLIEYIKWLNISICDGKQININQVSEEIDSLISKYK